MYGGFPGEPSLGPTAFMHRLSASENPSAPLSHHLQDSTHIAFGVVSTGFTYRWFKLEGSLFNGREPDENRYDFEFNPWNSRSLRFSFAPTGNLSMRLGIADHQALFRVGAYTFGAARDIWTTEKFALALGGDVTFYSKPAVLDSVYGDNPVSYKFFLRIRPGRMSM